MVTLFSVDHYTKLNKSGKIYILGSCRDPKNATLGLFYTAPYNFDHKKAPLD